MNPFLSVCLIIKNEEKVLRRCLESIKGIADEIIIVDTGSTDLSKSIASEYTDMIYNYEWEDDFSKARNFAASKASGEWIMAIDADEYVDRDSFIYFKNNLKDSSPNENILAVQIVNFLGANGANTVLNYHERIYKNDGKINYYRNIHEMLKHKDSLEKKGFAQLQFFHSGYMDDVMKDKDKSNRNLLLLESIKEKEGHDYNFLGDVYFQIGDLDKAITNYKMAFQLKGSLNYDWVVRLLVKLVNCLRAAKRSEEALGIVIASEEIYSKIVDFKFLKGQIFFNQGRDKEAIKIFEKILLEKDKLQAHSSIDYLEYLPHKHLGELYEKEKQLQLAVHHYSKSLSINDTDNYIWIRLINLLANHSSQEELVQFLNNNCLNRKTMNPIRLVKILLGVPKVDVQKLTRSFLDDPELSVQVKQEIMIKNLYLDGNYNEILNHFKNDTHILLSQGIFNITDLILLAIETKSERLRNILYTLKFEQSIKTLLDLIFNVIDNQLCDLEEDLFISILKQAYFMELKRVVEELKNKISYLSIEGLKRLNSESEIYNILI
jgi:glycosyltransferase involved in cell wall biosynthesis